jgi:hypothetical protein
MECGELGQGTMFSQFDIITYESLCIDMIYF